MYTARQDYDNAAWDVNEDESDRAVTQLTSKSSCAKAVSVVTKQFGKAAKLVTPLQLGGYNILYRVHVDGIHEDVLVRVPCPKLSQFPKEKTLQEAATGLILRRDTQLPIPLLFHYELNSELGPFQMLQYVENNGDVSDILEKPRKDGEEVPILDENIDEQKLRDTYSKLAWCLLQLWRPAFKRVGSLREQDGDILVLGRPITQNMSNMVQLANIPRVILPSSGITYETAGEWFFELATMHFAQLTFQHNDLVTSAEDCRNKYISRFLFRKLAKEGKLSTFGFAEDNWSEQASKLTPLCRAPTATDAFRLWCDDLRPANILVDASHRIVAVIDWEFTYAAPTQFILDPPWWLLLEMPEMWPNSIHDWAKQYEKRLDTWISCMEAEEAKAPDVIPFKLSEYMRESWKMGRFWLSYAARKSWAFDAIFWNFLDERYERFFGEKAADVPLWKCRKNLLSSEEIHAMEIFVNRKMKETEERILVDWTADEACKRLAEVLL